MQVVHFRVWTQTFIQVSSLRFTLYDNFSFLSNCWLLVFVFLQGSAVKTGVFNFFSQLCGSAIGNYGFQIIFFFGFKTQVFNFQFLTRPNISLSRFPNFWPKRAIFLFTSIGPLTKSIFPLSFEEKMARTFPVKSQSAILVSAIGKSKSTDCLQDKKVTLGQFF